MATTVIDEKGMLQIPKKIREELCLKSGEEFEIMTEGKKITFLPLINPDQASISEPREPRSRKARTPSLPYPQ